MPKLDRTQRLKIAQSYANAAYSIATKQKAVKALFSDIEKLDVLLDHEDAYNALNNPLYATEEKHNFLNKFLKKLKVSKITEDFLGTLVSRGRLNIMSEVIEKLHSINAENENIIIAKVVTATKLDSKTTDSIVKLVKEKTGKNCELNIEIDPNILGGLRLQFENYMIDDTLQTKLQAMQITLQGQA